MVNYIKKLCEDTLECETFDEFNENETGKTTTDCSELICSLCPLQCGDGADFELIKKRAKDYLDRNK